MPVSLSREDIDHIREGYRLFSEGDPAFLERYEPEATMVLPAPRPKGGTYGSPLEALEFFNNVGELFEAAHPEPEEFIRDGDRLVVLGHFHGRSRGIDYTIYDGPHGFREFGVQDSDGHDIAFGQRWADLIRPDLPQLVHVVCLVDPAMRVFLAEFDECL